MQIFVKTLTVRAPRTRHASPSSHRGKGRLRACTPKRLLTPHRAARRARRSPWNKAIHITEARLHRRPSASGHSCDRHRATPSASHLRRTAGHSCTPGGNSASREAFELSSCSVESTRYGRDDLSTSICSWQHFSKYQARTQAWPTVLPVVHTPAQDAPPRSEQERQLRTLRLSHHGCA